MTTLRAHLGRILRVNGDDRDGRNRRLVLNERSQLKKTPTAHLRSLILPEPFYERCSFAGRATWDEKHRVMTRGRVAKASQIVASVTCHQRSQRGREPLWWARPRIKD